MSRRRDNGLKIMVVIPCYRVKAQIMDVIRSIGPEVESIIVVDDCCPEGTGIHVKKATGDRRVHVLFHSQNQGVGGAMVTGYREALARGARVVVKIDGDGQMNPALIMRFARPILEGKADYTKGNRFFDVESLQGMPLVRLLGNAVLSFTNKMVSGYWDIMDPTNGYTAIHSSVLAVLPLDRVDRRYFFESDLLFRLGTVRAVVEDIPMTAVYDGEHSSLNIMRVAFEFPAKYLNRFLKRLFYQYFLRDFNAGTVELLSGVCLALLGGSFGFYKWFEASRSGVPATSGAVMLSAFPLLVGAQLLISAINYDIISVPRRPFQSRAGEG